VSLKLSLLGDEPAFAGLSPRGKFPFPAHGGDRFYDWVIGPQFGRGYGSLEMHIALGAGVLLFSSPSGRIGRERAILPIIARGSCSFGRCFADRFAIACGSRCVDIATAGSV